MMKRAFVVAGLTGALFLAALACGKPESPPEEAKPKAALPTASMPSPAGDGVVDDAFVRKFMPEFPQAVLFRPEHLALYSMEKPEERGLTEKSGGVYLLRGDFNGNGKPEIALAGLGSVEPIEGDYKGFVLVLEKDGDEWKDVGLEGFPKAVKPAAGSEHVRNLMLKDLGGGKIQIGFAAQSDFVGFLEWKGSRYEFTSPDF